MSLTSLVPISLLEDLLGIALAKGGDFAEIRVKYIPDKHIIELKSLKLYINRFRDQFIFHEEAVNRILDDLVKICHPRWMEVVGDFNPRGNVKTVVRAEHKKKS